MACAAIKETVLGFDAMLDGRNGRMHNIALLISQVMKGTRAVDVLRDIWTCSVMASASSEEEKEEEKQA